MEKQKNYYKILEVPACATKEQIKQAYKRLVKKWHPDLHNNSPESQQKLKEINEAYEILSDDTSRCMYNQTVYNTIKEENTTTNRKKTEYEEAQARTRSRVESIYQNRYKDSSASAYYEEFERIIEENKRRNNPQNLKDRIHITMSYLNSIESPIVKAFLITPTFLFAIFVFICSFLSDILFDKMFSVILSLVLPNEDL